MTVDYTLGFLNGLFAGRFTKLRVEECTSEDGTFRAVVTGVSRNRIGNAKHDFQLSPARQDGAGYPFMDGSRDLPFGREQFGRMVREAWVRWARTQPHPKPSWLVPYEDLGEEDKEADRQIGETIARWTIVGDAARAACAEMIASRPPALDIDGALQPRAADDAN